MREEKIGKIHGIEFKYVPKDAISENEMRLLGYFSSKRSDKRSKESITLNSLTSDDDIELEFYRGKPRFHSVKGYVHTSGSEYIAYTVTTPWFPACVVMLCLVILASLTLLLSGKAGENVILPLQQMKPFDFNKPAQENGTFDINLYSVGDITENNRYIPFTNSANNDLLCVYTFYDESQQELEKTDYIEPSDGEYYYFDAFKYFDAGEHTLYFTMQTFHADTGEPDTSANLSMPIKVIK